MNLIIKDIGPGGREVALAWGDDQVRAALGDAGVELASGTCGARLLGRASLQGAKVLLRGTFEGTYWVPCSRCLEPAAVRVAEPELALCFLPPAAAEDGRGPEIELSADDLETSTHDGVGVDLAALVREFLVLALPIAPRCGAACPGLSPSVAEAPAEGSPWREALARLKS